MRRRRCNGKDLIDRAPPCISRDTLGRRVRRSSIAAELLCDSLLIRARFTNVFEPRMSNERCNIASNYMAGKLAKQLVGEAAD
jgi:hypothetical protein